MKKDHPGYEWFCRGLLGLWGFEGLYSGDEVVPLGLRREPVGTISPGWALGARITLVALRAWPALWPLRAFPSLWALWAFTGPYSGDTLFIPGLLLCGERCATVFTISPGLWLKRLNLCSFCTRK